MTSDLSEFHDVFFEESFELLENMESALLELNAGSADVDLIHTIFRAAHSIKGGAATFGFTEVSEFTHTMETLLDEMRDGARPVAADVVGLLLESGDAVREMLESIRDGSALDTGRVGDLLNKLNVELGKSPAAGAEATAAESSLQAGGDGAWNITFRPNPGFFRAGHDPLRILRELQTLGGLSVEADISGLPGFSDIDPRACYMSWNLSLQGEATREQIEDVFAWVDGDCNYEIRQPDTADARTPDWHQEAEQARDVPEPAQRSESDGKTADKPKPAAPRHASAGTGSSSIRVDIGKIDALINMVGELVITQSMLSMLGDDFDMSRVERLRTGLDQLERHTRELQESVMRVRMVPISVTFNRFPRLVHDLSRQLDKKIELELLGESTEVDKTVIEKIGDPLVHLVRNSLDHGIESPADRVAAGKPETGTVTLSACHRGGNIVIEISDDGKGLDAARLREKAMDKGLVSGEDQLTDRQIFDLIFQPGFSTAEQVTDVSGRGVGMDVVRRNIMSLGGAIEIDSEQGAGTTITIRLPLTLAILDGQIAQVGAETYIVPLASIVETIQLRPDMINLVAGRGETFRLRDSYLPIIRLFEVFGIETVPGKDLSDGLLVVVESEGRLFGVLVDELQGQQQVVIKSLEANFRRVTGISGATILGDGSVALILDMPGVIRHWHSRNASHDLAVANLA